MSYMAFAAPFPVTPSVAAALARHHPASAHSRLSAATKESNMRLRSTFTAFVAVLALCATGAFAADKAQKQAEVRKATAASLQKFYKERPALQKEVTGAPGYAVFTTYGVSFIIGGGGGTGLAHDNATKKDYYMNMGKASAGLQVGLAQQDTLIVFKSQKALQQFVDKGWEFGGGGAISAGAGGHTAGGGTGEQTIADAMTYTLTKNGLDVGGALQGSKFWKDKDLN
jgi:lipid-binding SYLF domain-containing protein